MSCSTSFTAIRRIAVVLTVCCATLLVGLPAAVAKPAGTIIQPVRNNRCLTSTSSGAVSTVTCNASDSKQYWHSTDAHPYMLVNTGTGRCLMDNGLGKILTFRCISEADQRWWFSGLPGLGTFQNQSSTQCMASNSAGRVYAANCSGAGGETGWYMPSHPRLP